MRTFPMPRRQLGARGRRYLVLASLCLVSAAINVTKAIHIDDTAYLAIVDAILHNPLHVMSVPFNWQDTAEPIARLNQPHLFFYLQALVSVVFGRSELAQHLLLAGFACLAIVLFDRLALLVAPRRSLVLTALFALGPAFLPGQNLMVDVPLVALWLLFFWAILSCDARGAEPYVIAAFAAAAACLVKYTSLVLLVVFVAAIVRRRQWSALAWLAIPIAALAGWSMLNVIDYGRIHLFDRDVTTLSVSSLAEQAIDWLVGIGAVAPFTVAWWFPLKMRRRAWTLFVVGVACVAGMFFATLRVHYWSAAMAAWWTLFLANGLLTLGLVASGSVARRHGEEHRPHDGRAILWWWLAAVTLFVVPLAPFIAVRHVLLVVPAVLLLLGSDETLFFGPLRATVALVLTATLGIALAVSDYVYADAHRALPGQIQAGLPEGARIWSVGHWGWQWYATRAGMQTYDMRTTVLTQGDYVVVSATTHGQTVKLEQGTTVSTVRRIVIPATWLSWVRTVSFEPYGGYYAFSMKKRTAPPWLISTLPLDTITVFRVGN